MFLYIDNINSLQEINANLIVSEKIGNGIIVNYENNKIFIKTNQIINQYDIAKINCKNVIKINSDNSFYKYLKSKNVNYVAENSLIQVIGHKYSMKEDIFNYLSNGGAYYSRYVPLILLGKRYPKNDIILDKLQNISLIHLFTISGFHINIIIYIFEKIFWNLKIKNKYFHFLIYLFMILYILILGMPIAAMRAFIFSFLCFINKKFLHKKFHTLNLLSITMSIFFFINPYIVYSLSFVFTFLMTFVIVLLNSFANLKYKKIKMIIFTWIMSTMFNIYLNNEINFLSWLSNIFFTPIISFSYILTFFFFWLKPTLDNYYLILDIMINMFQFIKLSINLNLDPNWLILFISFIYILLLIIAKKPMIKEHNMFLKFYNWTEFK